MKEVESSRDELAKQVEALQKELANKNEEVQQASKEKDDLARERDDVRQERASILQEKDGLLTEQSQKFYTLKSERDGMDRAMIDLQSQVEKLNGELATKSGLFEEADRERQQFQSVIKERETILEKHSEKYEDLVKSSDSGSKKLEEEIERLKKTLAETERDKEEQINSLTGKIAQKEKRIEQERKDRRTLLDSRSEAQVRFYFLRISFVSCFSKSYDNNFVFH